MSSRRRPGARSSADLDAVEVEILRAIIPMSEAGSRVPVGTDVWAITSKTVGLRRADLDALIRRQALTTAGLLRRLERLEPGAIESVLADLEDPRAAFRKLTTGS